MVVKTLAKIVGAKAAGPAIKEGGGGGIEEVFITSNENLIGKILQVPIIRSTDFALEAKK